MPPIPCSFESFYTIHIVPNLAHMTQTAEFLAYNHCNINGLSTLSHRSLTVNCHSCTQAPLRWIACVRTRACIIVYTVSICVQAHTVPYTVPIKGGPSDSINHYQ